jgi:hypothetical protein
MPAAERRSCATARFFNDGAYRLRRHTLASALLAIGVRRIARSQYHRLRGIVTDVSRNPRRADRHRARMLPNMPATMVELRTDCRCEDQLLARRFRSGSVGNASRA